MSKIQPYLKIANENILGQLSASNNNCMVVADGIFLRKFDPAIIPSGSFNEFWLGFRWRRDNYNWNLNTDWTIVGDESTLFAFGLCDSKKPLPGESGSYTLSQMGHAIWIGSPFNIWDDAPKASVPITLTGSAATTLNFTTASYRINQSYYFNNYYAGFNTQSSTTMVSDLPFVERTYGPNAPIHNYVMFRFFTGSNGSWNGSFIHGNTTSSLLGVYRPMIMADAFKQSTWTRALNVMKTASIGFDVSVERGVNNITQSEQGYFDSIFFMTNHRFNKLYISEVIVKAF